jgi:thioredoxin reductase (NADPH)
MLEPVVLLVDGSATRGRIEAELRKRYEADYRVITTGSVEEALGVLGRFREDRRPVCLVLADQRLPGAARTQLLAQVRQLHPAARRAMLISWGDPASRGAVVEARG